MVAQKALYNLFNFLNPHAKWKCILNANLTSTHYELHYRGPSHTDRISGSGHPSCVFSTAEIYGQSSALSLRQTLPHLRSTAIMTLYRQKAVNSLAMGSLPLVKHKPNSHTSMNLCVKEKEKNLSVNNSIYFVSRITTWKVLRIKMWKKVARLKSMPLYWNCSEDISIFFSPLQGNVSLF